jgi:hypothetical protein
MPIPGDKGVCVICGKDIVFCVTFWSHTEYCGSGHEPTPVIARIPEDTSPSKVVSSGYIDVRMVSREEHEAVRNVARRFINACINRDSAYETGRFYYSYGAKRFTDDRVDRLIDNVLASYVEEEVSRARQVRGGPGGVGRGGEGRDGPDPAQE